MKSANRISALLHTLDNERTIGRALESLRVCDEVVVVDGGSRDRTAQIVRQFGARLIVEEASPGHEIHCAHDWVLVMRPEEAAAESLEAGLLEWRLSGDASVSGFRVAVREETTGGWRTLAPELRLVHRQRVIWERNEPRAGEDAPMFHGEILKLL